MSIIIIGSGLAGYLLAKELRALNTTESLRIITQSDGRFYSKPALSTAFANKKTSDTLAFSSALEMAQELNIEIFTNTQVMSIDAKKKIIYIQNNKDKNSNPLPMDYSQLVLACGSTVLNCPVEGDGVGEIFSVNDLEDYAGLRQKLVEKSPKKIAIMGAGLVGCEFAHDLCAAGYALDVIALASQPLERLLPEPLGRALELGLSSMGVNWHFNTSLKKITKINNSDYLYQLELNNKKIIPSDFVLSAIGLRANTDLAKTANISINKGIKVNNYLETNIPHIYALGDCAEVNGQLMFYVAPIRKCVYALARTLLGERTAVSYPAMSISIKTPICPVVACSPPEGLEGKWVVEGEGQDWQALYYDQEACLRGFALTGKEVKKRAELTGLLPPVF